MRLGKPESEGPSQVTTVTVNWSSESNDDFNTQCTLVTVADTNLKSHQHPHYAITTQAGTDNLDKLDNNGLPVDNPIPPSITSNPTSNPRVTIDDDNPTSSKVLQGLKDVGETDPDSKRREDTEIDDNVKSYHPTHLSPLDPYWPGNTLIVIVTGGDHDENYYSRNDFLFTVELRYLDGHRNYGIRQSPPYSRVGHPQYSRSTAVATFSIPGIPFKFPILEHHSS